MAASRSARLRGLEELWDLREVLHETGPGVGLPLPLLHGLQRLVRCDALAFNAMDSGRQGSRFWQTVEDGDWGESDDQGTVADPQEAAFWRHYWSSEPCHYPDSSGDLGSVTLRSDFVSDRDWRASPMYREGLVPYAHELMLVLPDGGPGRTLRLLAFRRDGADFTEEDRFLMHLLRPHVGAAYRRAQAHRAWATVAVTGPRHPPPQLTARQRQVLALVRDGATNAAIARRLGIAEGTVRKHLEHIHATLGVSSRTAAAVAAEDLL
ncbi:helix-turn-helix transcriptional regulator [Ornithinicoccus halotolerans]|uniref:helix-turn-helix transcriptional regulator n=1 Tax=Ornithinicoccus halotolerans TaxID=1748220 RepID=UPI001E5760B3|nr:helix-turn-helix transcriptional regulator [Ornithinicoccus halotolerans]